MLMFNKSEILNEGSECEIRDTFMPNAHDILRIIGTNK